MQTPSEDAPPTQPVVLIIPPNIDVPAFANLVLFNDFKGPSIGDQVILSFFHAYLGSPPDQAAEQPTKEDSRDFPAKAMAVARVTLAREVAESLRDLLIAKMPISAEDLERIMEEGRGRASAGE